ncbi:MAG: ATP-dependent Clp protease ATP-binding subunit [Patescibacteria group bacterium]|nr:ATP-dependent Clp protease ATP-binding subunit [Patescibacteria group bacterium]
MFNFYLKNTKIYKAIKQGSNLLFRRAGFLKKICFFAFAFCLGLCFFNFYFFGFFILFLCLGLGFWLIEAFFNSKIKNPLLKLDIKQAILNPEKYNLVQFLDFETARAVYKAQKFAETKNILTNSFVLLYFILKNNKELNFVFARAVLNKNQIQKILKQYMENAQKKINKDIIYSLDFEQTILKSLKIAVKNKHKQIQIGDMLTALSESNVFFKEILMQNSLKSQDIDDLCLWLEKIKMENSNRKKFWTAKNLAQKTSLAKNWAMGYTITLDKYSIDWSNIMKNRVSQKIGHLKEIEHIERILSRSQINNVLLVGRNGVGRKSIIQAIAQKSVFGKSIPQINHKRIVELDMPNLLARIDNVEQVESVLNEIFEEAISAGNIILVINNFHNFVGGNEGPGTINITGIISSFLRFPQFQIIAVSTYVGLHKYIEKNSSIISFFEKAEIEEVSQDQAYLILQNLVPVFEKSHNVFITQSALKNIIKYSDRYFADISFPKKAIDLLDEAVVFVANQSKNKVVLAKHISEIVSQKIEIPVGEARIKEKQILLNLEQLIHKRIINQEQAVNEISSAMRRARADIVERKKPIGTFLFLGSTGVGKTETAKALAEIYFKTQKRIIRLDMSEFQEIRDISRLIGSHNQEGILTTKIKEDPFSLVLLDEIEKAHPNVLNLFLQILDEGYVNDGLGRKHSFLNSIIIATSNAGANIIYKDIQENKELIATKQDLLSMFFEKRIFRPEFINRFDGVVIFKPLSKENLLDICGLMLKKVVKGMKQKEIEFIVTQELKQKIVDLSYSPEFGAREMKRVIQNNIESALANAILADKIKSGDKIEITPNEFKLLIK